MAKDVITRFKLETTQYDSKIKSAAKELTDFTKTATQAKEGFNQFTQANVDAAKALGTMATSTTNEKQRAQELVGAYNDLVRTYNHLNQEQQQSDFGKAMAESMRQLQQRIKDVKQEMQGPETGTGGFLSGDKLSGMLQVFGGNLMTKGASMLAGFASEMGDMVKQGTELAKQGEGIRIAFERLGRGDILDGLRQATHGTVTDLELMKAAVKFNDFKLPLEELGTMLAFAQQKAKDTGQSVDYMVDSIVTGLGRKSLMILDNLGLSATEIRERMKETGDMTKAVGAIIREQMAAAGDYVETAADRAAQATVSLQNKMEELGRKVAPLEESFNNLWTSMKVGILDVIGGPLTDLLNKLTQAGRMANQYSRMGGNTKVGRMTSNLANASEDSRQSIYQSQKSQFWKYINPREQQIQDIRAWQSGERNESLQKRINAITKKYGSLDTTKIQAEVDAAKKMLADYEQAAKPLLNPVNVNVNTQQAETNVKKLHQQLKELEEQRKKAVKAGDQEQVENLTKQISQVKTNIGYLDPKANKTGSSSKTAQTEIQENQAKINALTQEYVKLGDESTDAVRERQAEIQKEIELLQQRNGLLGLRAEQAQGRLTLGAGDFQRDGLSNTPGTLLKAPDTTIPRGGLLLDDKDMKAVRKNIDDSLPKKEKKNSQMDSSKKMLNAISQLTGGLQQMGIELPSEIQGVIGVIQGAMQVIEAVNTIIGITQTSALAANTAAMISLEAALWANTTASWFPFANGGIVPGFANGGVIDSGHSPSFLSFSKAAPAFATGGIIQKFNEGGTVDASHAPDFLSFSKGAAKKFATGGIIPKFAGGGTVDAGHAPDFLSFSKGVTKRFASGGTIPHANDGYFIGGSHFSGDVTPIMANAGELVLNKAQQGVIANQLQGGSGLGNLGLSVKVTAEELRFILGNNSRRRGKGEYVTTNRLR